ncbi:hypothetical protein DER29_4312 [Micromonospora sp. M71_S20]|uniref:AAA family ATPase n=1 Tax=Micromonospora sp. M71_S20 TaxID=592872 RepID=UPI000EAE6CA0|nr:AAA family ATPase [Micromonospora sp. M71_S20]RLK13295.1 hypothetical protein DER29_4312 [Micromonospora sp. M71_S20]
MTALRTRKPTGRVPWPLILIEGGEKSGKSWACAQFSTSPRIGQMYWIDLGEGAADEYGAIPGATYLVVEHDGTWAQIQAAVDAVKAEAARAAAAGEPPVVLVIDSMTAEWDLLKDWASDKARRRHEFKVRKYNAKPLGPDEEPKISMDLWNEAGARHRKLMTTLMTFPGIVLLTARGKEVAALDEAGKPIERQREYKVEGHKTLGYDVSCWIRLDRTKPGTVIGVRSVHVGIRPGYDDPIELARDWSIENIVFDTLGCAPAEAHTRHLVALQPAEPDDERPVSGPPAAEPRPAPTAIGLRDWTLHPDRTAGGIRQAAAKLSHEYPDIAAEQVTNEHGDQEQLSALMERRARELTPAPQAAAPSEHEERRRKRMFALLTELGYTERAQYRQVIGHVLKRDVASSKDITAAEVEDVIAALEMRKRQLRNQQPTGAAA